MKRTPLPSHDWSDPLPSGDRECTREGCSTVWNHQFDDPPPWGCKATADHSWSRDGRHYWTCENTGCTAREFSPDGEPDVGYACEGGLARSELERGSGCIIATCEGCGGYVWEAQDWECDVEKGFRHLECGWDGKGDSTRRALLDLQVLRSAALGRLGSKLDPEAVDRMVERIRAEVRS